MLGQGLNEEILRSHLAKYDVHVELGTELVGFEQNADSVTARLAHHVANQEDTTETISVEFLVGAEGARSQSHSLSLLLHTSDEMFLQVSCGKSLESPSTVKRVRRTASSLVT